FETLVVGAANRLAVTAAKAVAESPGAVYNPLFVYARPGLGKTHILTALGHAAQAINPGLTIEYLTLDSFIEAYHAAIASGQGDAYRRRFLEVDLLLVDDVQFLTGQRETQAELLRIIDAMQTASRQIVLTSDRPPSEIEALDERLIRRFAGGLVIDIAAPDYETRVAILRRRAEERKTKFDTGVLEAVARLEIDNVRELIGALHKLVAHQAVSDMPLTPARARAVLGAPPEAPAHSAAPANAVSANAAPLSVPAAGPVPAAAVTLEVAAAASSPTAPSAAASSPAVPSPAAPPGSATAAPADEFGDFLSDIAATVTEQIEAWRAKVAAAMLRWEGEGYQVRRLGALLETELDRDPEEALREFESAVRRLEAVRAEAEQLAPELAGSAAFRNPDDIAAAEALLERARAGALPPPGPSPAWQLESFVESTGNRVAVQAARAVVQQPGQRYNPLVLVGASGLGKTHLLHGIGNALRAAGAETVACLGAEEFTGELIEAIGRDGVAAWRSRYRRVDAFLLDDVHLIAGKDRSQDELFLLFNLFSETGRQMVFTSAVPLPQLAGVEARLLTRLEGGLVVDLPAPDRDIRQRVAERVLQELVKGADPEVAAYLASRPADSVRALQGLVHRVVSAAEAQQVQPTAAFARTVLEGATARAPRRPPARASGIVAPGGVKNREKMVWDWPDIGGRLVEEWR
ncbi:MAG TPA: DnaA/Hda family protein, partial [Gemmatimonadales bacterium]|nr:DnaA/Hda family protein [Gemmatimonadales bacterium]